MKRGTRLATSSTESTTAAHPGKVFVESILDRAAIIFDARKARILIYYGVSKKIDWFKSFKLLKFLMDLTDVIVLCIDNS